MQENRAESQPFTTFPLPTYLLDDFDELCSLDLPPVHTSLPEYIRHRQLLFLQDVMQPDQSLGVRRTNKGNATLPAGLAALWC